MNAGKHVTDLYINTKTWGQWPSADEDVCAPCLRYNKLSRNIRDLAQKIRDLDEKDGFRAQSTHRLLEKLWVTHCSVKSLCVYMYVGYSWDNFSSHQVQHWPHSHQTGSLPHRESHSVCLLQVNIHHASCCRYFIPQLSTSINCFLPTLMTRCVSSRAGGGCPASCSAYAWLRTWRRPSHSLNKDVSFITSLVWSPNTLMNSFP